MPTHWEENLKGVRHMKISSYKNYDDLPLFLNAATVAKVLGIAPSSSYELPGSKNRQPDGSAEGEVHGVGRAAYGRTAMRGAWSAAAAPPNEFCLPHEVFKLGLGHGPLPVYLYLIYCKSMGHRADKMNCAIISKAVSWCEKTVRTHLRALADAGFIKVDQHGQTFSYTLCPIQAKVHRCYAVPRNRWISTKRDWLTGEVFDAVFPVPNEVFQLGLKPGELLVYIYLHYQKGVRSGQCWPEDCPEAHRIADKQEADPSGGNHDPPEGWTPLQRPPALHGHANPPSVEGAGEGIFGAVETCGSPAEVGLHTATGVTAPVSRFETPCAHPVRRVASVYTSHPLKRGVGPCVARCG